MTFRLHRVYFALKKDKGTTAESLNIIFSPKKEQKELFNKNLDYKLIKVGPGTL